MNDWRRISLLTATLLPGAAAAAELPVACIAGSCGTGVAGFVSSGSASATSSGNLLRVDQQSDKAILNWSSFDLAAGNRVEFHQPGASSIALNRIFQESPSRIFGAIEANGQIYLVNQNGFLFGAGSRVNTAGLIASTLNITEQNFAAGLVAPEVLNRREAALVSDGRSSVRDAAGNPVLGEDGQPLAVRLVVEQGAEIATSGTGGRVLLASRTVENSGSIATPGGQTVLAAGEKVYLQASTDPSLRGLVVEVDGGGTAWNRLTGNLSASEGNVTLVGLAVNQDGRATATTTVSANGSIRLLARDTTLFHSGAGGNTEIAARDGGRLSLGVGSVTAVTPALEDTRTAVDDQPQLPSSVELSGRQIWLREGARIHAPGGTVTAAAQATPGSAGAYDSQSRLRIAEGVVIDVSGTAATAPVTRNLLTVELRANEMRDSPVQRDGFLRGKTVVVDRRVGTPVADISGALGTLERTVAERTSAGGTVTLASDGDAVIAAGAQIDVSGGQVTYTPGIIQTTQLMQANGRVVDIGAADPDVRYTRLINPTEKRSYERWGVTETVANAAFIGRYDPGYVEGRDGGTLNIIAPVMSLAGQLRGTTVIGELQRDPAAAPRGALLRIGDPFGAITQNYRAPDISFVTALKPLAVGDDSPLPRPLTLELPVAYLREGGFQRTEIHSNGVVELDLPEELSLVPGSSLLLSGRAVSVQSDITAPGGNLGFSSTATQGIPGTVLPAMGVTLGDGVTLDVGGQWVNDYLPLAAGASAAVLAPLNFNAGSISLDTNTSGSSLVIGDGVALRADGGAWLHADRHITGGAGGLIRLGANAANARVELGESIVLSAFGVNGAAGGSFGFAAPRVSIVEGPQWASAQQFDDVPQAEDSPRSVELGTALFRDHGFSHFSIEATGPTALSAPGDAVLTVASGAQISASPQQWRVLGNELARPGGGTVREFAGVYTPRLDEQNPVSLHFEVRPRSFGRVGEVGRVELQAGSYITTPAESEVVFASPAGVVLAGTVAAPAGRIVAHVPIPAAEGFDPGYDPALQLEVAAGALLDVSGTTVYRPNAQGLRQGDVLPGGTLSLVVDRGSVRIDARAQLRADGASAVLDLSDPDNPSSRHRPTQVGSDAGRITLRAPESVQVLGDFSARAGGNELAPTRGGILEVQLTRERGFQGGASDFTFPTTPRVLQLTSASIVSEGPLASGTGIFHTGVLDGAGFDALLLEAGDRIEIVQDLDLELARSLRLDTPELRILNRANVSLQAPYVGLGAEQALRPALTATGGDGQLRVSGTLIDLIGQSVVSGARTTSFDAGGDIRLFSTNLSHVTTGSLEVAGNIVLRSQRVYPTTYTDFTVRATGAGSTVSFLGTGGSADDVPLSVNGGLSVFADHIVQDGTLLAPFGRISLNGAQSVRLGSGSLTSVSGAGAILPFGQINLGEWQYEAGSILATQTGIPARRIDVAGEEVVTESGAVLDLAGGGDLYAYEWTPGTGGSRDALAATSGLYAVFPQMRDGAGAYGPMEWAGSDLAAGESIYLAGNALLPEGIYPLLPARYALLPGAVLVEAVAGYAELTPARSAALADGTPVVAGRRVAQGTQIGDGRYSGYAIRAGEYGRQLAFYEDTFASEYFARVAARQELGRAPLPADAAALGFQAGSTLDLRGSLITAGASGGRNAAVDISAPELHVLTDAGNASAGAVGVDAAAIAGWDAGSLLLGGRRDAAGDITLTADRVLLGADAEVKADEVLLVAAKEVLLQSGARLASTAAATVQPEQSQVLRIGGEGAAGAAVVGVSDLRELSLVRDDSAGGTTQGRARLDAGSSLASRTSLLVAAPGGAELAGTLSGAGAAWDVSGSHIVVAEAPVAGAVTLSAAQLAAMSDGRSLRLGSDATIDFHRSAQLGGTGAGDSLQTLELHASALRVIGGGHAVALGSTEELRLRGTETVGGAPASGTGTLHLASRQITLDEGIVALSGFGDTQLEAAAALYGTGVGGLATAGALTVNTPLVTTAAGADTTLRTTGAFTLAGSGEAGATPLDATGLGGAFTIDAHSIEATGARLLLPSGAAILTAVDALRVGDGMDIDVAGRSISIVGRQLDADAGAIRLAAGGALDVAAGATLDVSASGSGLAGSVRIDAGGQARVTATLRGAADQGSGGSFDLHAGSLVDFAGLNRALQAGGFSGERRVGVATGDLLLAAGETISARAVQLSAESGTVEVAGTIRAVSADQRASIGLFGGTGVLLTSTASLEAAGEGESSRGGIVTLSTEGTGSIDVAPGSHIATPGGLENGHVNVRASAVGDDVAVDRLGAVFTGVSEVRLEPFLRFDVGSSFGASQWSGYAAGLTSYTDAAKPLILDRLGGLQGTSLRLTPGLQFDRLGDLSVGALDLTGSRFGGEAANLAFRVSGSLSIQGTVSDGFTIEEDAGRLRTSLPLTRSGSLGFAAGTDFLLATNAVLRTATGDLSVTAGRDIVFGSGSSLYTAGVQGESTVNVNNGPGFAFAAGGGQIALRAGRDILGAPVTQSVTDWQPRTGRTGLGGGSTIPLPLRWGVDVAAFRWNLGSFGGGDVSIQAGGNIDNLSAAMADSAFQETRDDEIRYFHGGVLDLHAGGNVNSLHAHLTHGENRLVAGGAFGRLRERGSRPLGSLFSLQDASLQLRARTGIALESVFTPTFLGQGVSGNQLSYFFTYGDTAGLSVRSAAGDVELLYSAERLDDFIGTAVRLRNTNSLSILPPRVELQALSRDLLLGGAINLFPADDGQLDLVAARDIDSRELALRMSDAFAGPVPTPAAPVGQLPSFGSIITPAASARHRNDTANSVITAGRDILGGSISLPEAVTVTAGRDLHDTTLVAQNTRDTDLTRIAVGRDIVYSFDASTASIEVGGPGAVAVLAGGDIDLGISRGITTIGNIANPQLPTAGADISVLAGLAPGADVAGFLAGPVADSEEYRKLLIETMQAADFEAAREAFLAQELAAQLPYVSEVFFSELVRSGREVNTDPRLGFERGYRAIDALFPGSRPEGGSDEVNPHAGDLRLALSRIYTLAGGDISLFVPGGLVNVGLAVIPPSLGVQRNPSDLGIVAQKAGDVRIFTAGDVLVNASRIFTLGGGDIAVWSTLGDIDAGRGAKSAISAPPPRVSVDTQGNVIVDLGAAVSGSGIRTIIAYEGAEPGDVDLIAPRGIVNAGDAGIGSAGNLNVAAQQVVGLDNIQVGGASTGVPAETGNLGAALSGASAAGAAAGAAAGGGVDAGAAQEQASAPLAQSALSFLDVFVEGFGEEVCRPTDEECLRRNRPQP